jgi:pyrroloquinoline-quinone synthase
MMLNNVGFCIEGPSSSPADPKNRQKGTRKMDVLTRLDEIRAEINVLEHPFYERWSAGELSTGELDLYAGEYRHAVLALAQASADAAVCAAADAATVSHAPGLRRHAAEEAAHVALWEQFERAVAPAVAASASSPAAAQAADQRAGSPREELAQTRACVHAWTAGESLLEHLAVLYAIEAGQPQISSTKLEGLTAHYGLSEEGPATEYFRVHELRDVEHAREARELIARLLAEVEDADAQAERMLECARAALRGNWLLLDGVEAGC